MKKINCLYKNIDELKNDIKDIKGDQSILVQIFTSKLGKNEAVSLARDIQMLFPSAQIIGASVNAVIYNGEQYDVDTLITIEQYEKITTEAFLVEFGDKNYYKLVKEVEESWLHGTPELIRLFVGGYYDYTHQFVQLINKAMPRTKLAGGNAGEIAGGQQIPYVFNTEIAIEQGMIFSGIKGSEISTYCAVNTSQECITPAYTVTGTDGLNITSIEDQPAAEWLQNNLGVLSTRQYHSWEDIAKNDPLVRFQLNIEGQNGACRCIKYDEESQHISQYFTRLSVGESFRISYTSPTKCVEDSREICEEMLTKSLESVFCYSCLFRKLYMKNCAKWELLPFKDANVCGVFLLGEFGTRNGSNEVFNGSCVLVGIGEGDTNIPINMDAFHELQHVQHENDDLKEFVKKKLSEAVSETNGLLLDNILVSERAHELYKYIDTNVNLMNIKKYDQDKDTYGFNKICLVQIENSTLLISHLGQAVYYERLRELIEKSKEYIVNAEFEDLDDYFKLYSIAMDTFIVLANDEVSEEVFVGCMNRISQASKSVQLGIDAPIFLQRFVIVMNQNHLVERAYNQLRLCGESQEQFLISNGDANFARSTQDELAIIDMINYSILNDKVQPYYQGIYNNKTKRIDKYEALMRIEDSKGNVYPPFAFMHVAKKYRLYLSLTKKMVEKVSKDFEEIPYMVSINLSSLDIESKEVREFLVKQAKEFKDPSKWIFEILEDECFQNINVLKEFIADVRQYGVKIAIDDFGAGYSNLLEIVKIEPDYIKVDGGIIREVHTKHENRLILDSITTLFKKMDIEVVAEFVENQQIQDTVVD
ncbi:MAG: EAL domain-containing protein, partial [Eubacteriales bacterium]